MKKIIIAIDGVSSTGKSTMAKDLAKELGYTYIDTGAMRWLAKKENIPLIELHNMTRALYEALGVENSVKAFVHYPANTFPQQTEALADNTHFNPYGAYEIAKCVIEGMKGNHFDFVKYLLPDYKGFDPAHPDDVQEFHWDNSPFTEVEKPDGN